MDNTSSSGPSKGGASPEYSNTEFVAGMSPLSPYLNVDPRYFTHVNLNIAFFTIGGCCITCAAVGALNWLLIGISETKDMALSKPRNVQLLNLVTLQGATWANTLGPLVCLGVAIKKARLAEYDINTVAAGIMTGKLMMLNTERKNLISCLETFPHVSSSSTQINKDRALAHISLTFAFQVNCVPGNTLSPAVKMFSGTWDQTMINTSIFSPPTYSF
uniref:Uncharacterized protein n=1 Tax=Oncorhynchus mykiss TaxID=8022 RepID=A0A8C7SU38_ONCMY